MCITANPELDADLQKKIPSAAAAIKVLKDEFMKFKQDLHSTPAKSKRNYSEAFGTPAGVTKQNATPPPQKKAKFQIVKKLASSTVTSGDYYEIDNYLKMEILDGGENSDPLKFWNCYEKTFPILSKIARQYLAIPASSGSVERLFSVAGAIARARRACIGIDTLEMVLCYRQFLKNRNKNDTSASA